MSATSDLINRPSGRAVLRNGATIASVRFVTAGLGLLTIPIIIAKLGLIGFGAWEAMMAVATLASTLQGCFTGTLMWRMSQAYGGGRAPHILRLVRYAITISLTFCALLVPLAIVIADIVARRLNVPPELQSAVRAVFPCMVAILAVAGVADAIDAAISATQRAGTASAIGAVALVSNTLVTIAGLFVGAAFWALVAGQVVAMLIRIIAGRIIISKVLGRASLLPAAPANVSASSMRYAALLAVGYISMALREQTDKIVLAAYGSPVLVAYYGLASRLANLLMEVNKVFYIPLLTAAGVLHSMRDWQAISRLYGLVMQALPLVTGTLLILIGGLANQVITLWVGKPVPGAVPLLLVLLLGSVTAVTLTGPGTSICRGIGMVGIETRYVVVNLVANVTLTIVLVQLVGAYGSVVASGTTWALASLAFLVILHKHVDLPAKRSRNAALSLLLAAVISLVLALLVARTMGTEGRITALFTILAVGSPSVLAYIALVFLLRLIPRESGVMAFSWLQSRFATLLRTPIDTEPLG